MHWQAGTLFQPSVVMGRSPAGKHPRSTYFVRRDGELAPVQEFMHHLYGTPEQPTTNHARLPLFDKVKKSLETFPPTRDTLELHAIPGNYQAKIWLQANKEHIYGDMQLQVKEQDCRMFLLQENHAVHYSMWMRCNWLLQPSWTITSL